LDIVFIGNSITYGANLENPRQYAPPVIAFELLHEKSGINSVQFANQGRSGFTTVNYLPESPTFSEVVDASRQLHNNPEHELIFRLNLGQMTASFKAPKVPLSWVTFGPKLFTKL